MRSTKAAMLGAVRGTIVAMPTRNTLSRARAPSGGASAAPPSNATTARRVIACPSPLEGEGREGGRGSHGGAEQDSCRAPRMTTLLAEVLRAALILPLKGGGGFSCRRLIIPPPSSFAQL